MDLREFIKIHMKNNTLDTVSKGFQNSHYIDNINDLILMIKTLLGKMLVDVEKQKNLNQLQSGGIATHFLNSPSQQAKKQSFCTEFPIMINNILGLLGFEFSKYLFVLFGAKKYIARLIDDISEAMSYEDIEKSIVYIRNMLLLGTAHRDNKIEDGENVLYREQSLVLDEDFDISRYITKIHNDDDSINYFTSTSTESTEQALMEYLLNDVALHIKSENIISFDADKARWLEILNDMLVHLVPKTYIVNSVNDFVINLGQFNICYDKSFWKLFDILYMESFADIPYEFWNTTKPYVDYIERELQIDMNCSKYQFMFNQYFRRIFDNTCKTAKDDLKFSFLEVIVTDNMFDRLSDIAFYLFLNICRKITNSQVIYTYFGKSTRIQFIQLFQAFVDCAPRMHSFSKSQLAFLHYILLSDKVIIDSIKVVNDEEQMEKIGQFVPAAKKPTRRKNNERDNTDGEPKKRGRKSNKEIAEMKAKALEKAKNKEMEEQKKKIVSSSSSSSSSSDNDDYSD